ncbi:MAG TPA: CDP-alcohol phosphatidyltransferase family protein [Bryobacteraceae bacterium]|nr:CDP-alcohol phosphatidyltransferase family protein [Bryobacteraceae bacterium]
MTHTIDARPARLLLLIRLIPNFLTSLRLLCSPLLAWLIVRARFSEALLVVGFAALTDWLDGYTARRLQVSGKSGLVLDPLADKVMLVTLFCALTYAGLIPLWFFVLVVLRDLVIVVGALLVRLFRNVRKFVPTEMGKVSTFFQLTYALLALLLAAYAIEIIFWLERTALVLATLFTVASGIGYVRMGIRIAAEPTQKGDSAIRTD